VPFSSATNAPFSSAVDSGFLQSSGILAELDSAGVQKVVLVPGEPNSDKSYSLPPLARMFPRRNVAAITNALTKAAISVTGTWKHIHEGNAYVQTLVQQRPERILQEIWSKVDGAAKRRALVLDSSRSAENQTKGPDAFPRIEHPTGGQICVK
jgi:hypothetical protein